MFSISRIVVRMSLLFNTILGLWRLHPSFRLSGSVPQIQRNHHFNSSWLLLPSKGEPIFRVNFGIPSRTGKKPSDIWNLFDGFWKLGVVNSLQDGRNPSLPRMYKISVDSGINSLLTRLPDLFHQKYGSRWKPAICLIHGLLPTFYDYRVKATFSKHIPLDEAQTVEVAGVQDLPQHKLSETAVVVTILHTNVLVVLCLHRFYCHATCSPFSIHLVFCELSWTELAQRLLFSRPTFYK